MSDAAEAAPEVAPEVEVDAAPAEATSGDTPQQEAPAPETPETGDGAAAEFAWPDDWGSKLARGDEAKAKEAGRYASPEAVLDALIESKKMIREKGVRQEFPADGTDEAKAEWRKQNGLPASFEEYNVQLEEGMVIGDEHKPLVDGFLEGAHGHNMTQEQVNYALSYQVALEQQQRQQQDEADAVAKKATQNELMQEWGGNYNANIDEIKNHLTARYGKETGELLDQARLPDGTMLGSNPAFVRALLQDARDMNPGSTIVPGSSDVQQSVKDEIASIRKFMKEDRGAYDKDRKMQDRFAELLEWEKEHGN